MHMFHFADPGRTRLQSSHPTHSLETEWVTVEVTNALEGSGVFLSICKLYFVMCMQDADAGPPPMGRFSLSCYR